MVERLYFQCHVTPVRPDERAKRGTSGILTDTQRRRPHAGVLRLTTSQARVSGPSWIALSIIVVADGDSCPTRTLAWPPTTGVIVACRSEPGRTCLRRWESRGTLRGRSSMSRLRVKCAGLPHSGIQSTAVPRNTWTVPLRPSAAERRSSASTERGLERLRAGIRRRSTSPTERVPPETAYAGTGCYSSAVPTMNARRSTELPPRGIRRARWFHQILIPMPEHS